MSAKAFSEVGSNLERKRSAWNSLQELLDNQGKLTSILNAVEQSLSTILAPNPENPTEQSENETHQNLVDTLDKAVRTCCNQAEQANAILRRLEL